MRQDWDDQIERVATYMHHSEHGWARSDSWADLPVERKRELIEKARTLGSMFNFPGHTDIVAGFDALCVCDHNPETTNGPERECPIHGETPWAVMRLVLAERVTEAARTYVHPARCPEMDPQEAYQVLTEAVRAWEDHEDLPVDTEPPSTHVLPQGGR